MKFSDESGREVTIDRLGRFWYSVETSNPGPPGAAWLRTGSSWCALTRLGAVWSAKRWLRQQRRRDAWRTRARYGLR